MTNVVLKVGIMTTETKMIDVEPKFVFSAKRHPFVGMLIYMFTGDVNDVFERIDLEVDFSTTFPIEITGFKVHGEYELCTHVRMHNGDDLRTSIKLTTPLMVRRQYSKISEMILKRIRGDSCQKHSI